MIDRPNYIYIGGELNNLYSINTITGQYNLQYLTHDVTSIDYDRFVCIGSSNGQVSLLDHRMSQVIKTFTAHPGMILSLDMLVLLYYYRMVF